MVAKCGQTEPPFLRPLTFFAFAIYRALLLQHPWCSFTAINDLRLHRLKMSKVVECILKCWQRRWSPVAKATMRMPDDFQKKLSKLGEKTDEIVSKVLESGGGVVLDKVKQNLKGVIGS